MAEHDDEKPRRGIAGVEIKREISFGQLVNAGVMVVGFLYAISTYVGKVDSTQHDMASLSRDLASLRSDMVTTAAATQSAMAKQIDGVRLDIANLPDVKAEMVQLGRRADQADSRFDAQSKRLEQIEHVGIQNSSDINNLLRVVGGMQRSSK